MKLRTVALMLTHWTHPSLMTFGKDGNLHYETFPQNVGPYNPKQHTIVKEYGYIDTYSKEWDDLLVQFVLDFPPKIGIDPTRDIIGWLAPDGIFYPCHWHEHDSIADYIFRYVYHKVPSSAVGWFERKGWRRISHTCIHFSDIPLTQKQIDTLGDILLLASDELAKDIRYELNKDESDY